ncbi:MAG: IMP cyclohydrolase [Deltaproteobacteria bacterium]|nr:IMP cyclohydrolase [Deltaproteobacteria bacterium]
MEHHKTAILSVFDKTGIEKLGKFLVRNGYRILSTGGTSKILKENSIDVIDVSDHTGFPEILDGRVKTLHPRIHSGILARDTLEHLNTLEKHGIPAIDLVVVNLYPFQKTLENPDSTEQQIVEMIDIGGPTMLRAAAKNFERVVCLSDSSQYEEFMDREKHSRCDLNFRKRMAAAVFRITSEYDKAVAGFLGE